jgi:hypothetical protein
MNLLKIHPSLNITPFGLIQEPTLIDITHLGFISGLHIGAVVLNQITGGKSHSPTKEITGDLNPPHSGILIVLPVTIAYRLDRK